MTLVNAGAIASGNLTTRQLIQTAAILFVLDNGRFHITHIDVNSQKPYQPQDVVDLDFITALQPYTGSILSPELQALAAKIKPTPEMYKLLWQLAPACWWGDKNEITWEDVELAYNGTLDFDE